MARDGNGTYALPAGNPVVTGTTISSTVQNNTMNDVAAALTASIANDGQTTPTADLKMGTFKHKNVGNAGSRISTNANYATAADVQDGTITFLTGTAGTNTITASAPLGLVAYVTGQVFRFIPAATNTAAATLNINSIGAKSLFANGKASSPGALKIGVPVEVIYDGTQFHLVDSGITLATEQVTTSGTSFDFTGIPSGVKRITIMFVGVSTNGSQDLLVQIGDSGGIESASYVGSSSNTGTSAGFTTGFGIKSEAASNIVSGTMVLTLENAANFTWTAFGVLGQTGNTNMLFTGGHKSLSAELDRVRITTLNGADTFDLGAINISYE